MVEISQFNRKIQQEKSLTKLFKNEKKKSKFFNNSFLQITVAE
jgi:hypothetical protein